MEIYIEKDQAYENEGCFSCGYPFDTGDDVLSDQHHMVFCSRACVKMVYREDKYLTFLTAFKSVTTGELIS